MPLTGRNREAPPCFLVLHFRNYSPTGDLCLPRGRYEIDTHSQTL
jgi:hypothetical protein